MGEVVLRMSAAEIRNDFRRCIDHVCYDKGTVLITRHGRPVVAMVPIDVLPARPVQPEGDGR